ncbi:hypothetical protein PISL3812_07346 [Talaromyces islandicus]|uniref:Calcineurin-like phosphoesterase domain-containing protein n=1 Tax=Talaromyces islandicus TaxID=28573 RepID=A0A0U1M3Y7_TALIS|nr:hypothetical protein PISL3812_07346 [Talaromyces islandicus]
MDSTPRKTVKTRICMISDTHTHTPHPAPFTTKPYRHPLPSADVLLHAGDLTGIGRLAEHEIMVSMLKQASTELKLVIAGNHDITLDKEYYALRGVARHGSARVEDVDEIRRLYTNEEARQAGIVYMEEEVRTFSLQNGAQFTVYASPYTPEFCGWAFAYERDQDRFNPAAAETTQAGKFQAVNPVPLFPKVDIMLTHGPPLGILDTVEHGEKVGCEHLLRACGRARPRLHVFGHIHEGFGAVRHNWQTNTTEAVPRQDPETVQEQRSCYYNLSGEGDRPLSFGEETLFVNASVVTVRYHADNAPWVVDLDLPASQS